MLLFASPFLAAAVIVSIGLLLGPYSRYDDPPDSSWKDRGAYCYFIRVDPGGDRNTRIGWADEAKRIETSTGSAVEAFNVRVSANFNGRLGLAARDSFEKHIVWTAGVGFIDIRGCR